MTAPAFEGWAILELMGHRQRPGFVQEVEIAGGKMMRVDIPAPDGAVAASEFYGCAAIYCLRPVAEEIARDAAKRMGDIRPVRPVEYRENDAPRLPLRSHAGDDLDDEQPF